jgi:hypothetical protein
MPNSRIAAKAELPPPSQRIFCPSGGRRAAFPPVV